MSLRCDGVWVGEVGEVGGVFAMWRCRGCGGVAVWRCGGVADVSGSQSKDAFERI